MIASKLGTFHSHEAVVDKESHKKERQKQQYNKRHRSKNLSPLNTDDKVWITDLRVYGKIAKIDNSPNSYWIQTSKNLVRRNRWSLIPAPYCKDFVEENVHYTLPPTQMNESGQNEMIENQNNCQMNELSQNNCNTNNNERPVQQRKEPTWMKDYIKH